MNISIQVIENMHKDPRMHDSMLHHHALMTNTSYCIDILYCQSCKSTSMCVIKARNDMVDGNLMW